MYTGLSDDRYRSLGGLRGIIDSNKINVIDFIEKSFEKCSNKLRIHQH